MRPTEVLGPGPRLRAQPPSGHRVRSSCSPPVHSPSASHLSPRPSAWSPGGALLACTHPLLLPPGHTHTGTIASRLMSPWPITATSRSPLRDDGNLSLPAHAFPRGGPSRLLSKQPSRTPNPLGILLRSLPGRGSVAAHLAAEDPRAGEHIQCFLVGRESGFCLRDQSIV